MNLKDPEVCDHCGSNTYDDLTVNIEEFGGEYLCQDCIIQQERGFKSRGY